MFKRLPISCAVALALGTPQGALAVDTYAYIKNETAIFTNDGSPTNSARSVLDSGDDHDAGDLLKFENQARLYVNGDISDNATWHAELLAIYDTEATDDGGVEYQGHRLYSQQDFLRELYLDYYGDQWEFRLGKQQVVWGTADGIKLLDIINPTDFRELNQNAFEDARIPIWMLKAERNFGDSSNIQFIVAQQEENKIPGLNQDGDQGHPFILKGVDTITGEVNGFLNIAPNLANVAQSFNLYAQNGAFAATGAPPGAGLVPFTSLTVHGFAGNELVEPQPTGQLLFPGQPGFNPANAVPGHLLLNDIAQNATNLPPDLANNYETNLMSATGTGFTEVLWRPNKPGSAFEYMPNATFATFNTFANATSSYVRDYPDDENVNAGFRFKHRMDNGFNFSLNYFYHYSSNPSIDVSWHDPQTNDQLQVIRARQAPTGFPDPSNAASEDDVPNAIQVNAQGFATNSVTMLLRNPRTGQYYGPIDPTTGAPNANATAPELRFTESLHRVNSFGAAFDYAVDGLALPVVLRGEFLYDKDDMQPIVDKRLLAIGDLSNALKMEEADYFKYVIGVDVTVLTNMLVSGQFIQFRNLDYQEDDRTCFTQPVPDANFNVGATQFDCSRYTADFPTLHLDNGLNKAYENKEFYSLFFSKPFGASDEHRWNNITIYEEGGGWWNRFDVEYSFTDTLLGTAEWNAYWGDENTQFGQFEDSSNLQVGLKYLIE